jgi:twitching motility protein PilI
MSGEICPIPGVPPTVLGVVNQRGRLLWVLELSDLLGLVSPKRLESEHSLKLVVLTASTAASTVGAERQLGCVVSALKGIVTLDSTKFKPVSAKLFPTLGSFLSGVAEIEDSPVAVLNVNAVLTAVSVPNNSWAPL